MRSLSMVADFIRSDAVKHTVRGLVLVGLATAITAWSYFGIWLAWAVIH